MLTPHPPTTPSAPPSGMYVSFSRTPSGLNMKIRTIEHDDDIYNTTNYNYNYNDNFDNNSWKSARP